MDEERILAALAQLTVVVGELAAKVEGAAPIATRDLSHIHLTQDSGYVPLVPSEDANVPARYRLGKMLHLTPGSPAMCALMDGGARGFYRGLAREEGQLRVELPRDTALALIADANTEDPREALDMSHDLLKVWQPTEAPIIGVDRPDMVVGELQL